MKVKTIKDEVFNDYKKCSMLICAPTCTFKCCIEQNLACSVCQNEQWQNEPIIEIDEKIIIQNYLNNPLTSAIVFGGLEPMDNFKEIIHFINIFRNVYKRTDDVVIYTGYYNYEIPEELLQLKQFNNIIIKFGRYIPNNEPHYDDILGITLSSDNQYAIKLT